MGPDKGRLIEDNWMNTGDLDGDGRDDFLVQVGSKVAIIRSDTDGKLVYPGRIPAGFTATVTNGDFNGDGRPDLAATSGWNDRVEVSLGNGDGTFQSAVFYAVGSNPSWIATGDIDDDGYADLITVNYLSDDLSVLRGQGDGTFGDETRFPAGFRPVFVVIGDFNGDEIQDLAVSNQIRNYIRVLLGDGAGTFSAPIITTAPYGPLNLAASDFDLDGHLDLAVGHYSDHVKVFAGRGDGTFATPLVLPVPGRNSRPVVIADFDADGFDDIASGQDLFPWVDVFLNRGDGTFHPSTTYRTWTNTFGADSVALAVVDFNRDGRLDLISGAINSNVVGYLQGIGDGTFAPVVSYHGGSSPGSFAVADFDSNGWEDLVIADIDIRGELLVLLNRVPFAGVCEDADGDGFGLPGDPVCPSGAVTDCDDTDASIAPGAVDDTCDGIDQDCDGVDVVDLDDDGFTICDGDCNDLGPNQYPGRPEFCGDGVDNDCDGMIDAPNGVASDVTFDPTGTAFTWTASPGMLTYNVYRGGTTSLPFVFDHLCFASPLTQPEATDPAIPALGRAAYYLISGTNGCGEGLLGFASSGQARPNLQPCP